MTERAKFPYIQDQRVRNLPYMVSDRQNGKTILKLIFGRPGGFSGIRAGPSRVGGGWGGSGRFFEISERQRPARSSGRLGIHDFASEILPNPCGRLQSLLILLNFLDFLLNSLIFHDYSLKCSRGAGQEAPTWMVTGGDWRWGGFKSYNRARKIMQRAKFFIYSRSGSSKPSI